ncbi:helix-turn-helix domain-containing protein [Hydrogenophaga sp. NFH-34]|uniref:helix-turn-helix domain-containing protein n=1 Tax=Hydrogenophaga sp. NFH-34 TaxID=2744446 RepID=UPI001F2A9CAE|nr:helix-turn-helix transcriptional regulator [Hydrogenophaga sp. NFH-34]
MSTLNDVLKSEITRLSRKLLKSELEPLKKAAHSHRSEIAALKREVKDLRGQLKAQGKVVEKVAPVHEDSVEKVRRPRAFGPAQFAALREKLDLSQAEMAKLLGCSALSVARWESGKAAPRAAQLQSIAAVRGIGKREAAKRLAAA